MRMEQYIQMVDYSLWDVIENGNAPLITQVVKGVETIITPATAEEKAQIKLKLKARSTLFMGILNEHQLKLNSIKDAKCQSEVLKKSVTKRNTHTIMWRNKPEIDTLRLDDLYNNLKIYEPEVKGTSSLTTNIQDVAFVSSNSTSNTNGVVNTAHGVTTASTQTTADLQQIHPDDLEEIDLRWQMAMLTMRARRILKNTGRKFSMNGNETIGFDKSKVECYNYHKRGHFAKECRASRSQDTKHKESTRRTVPIETPASSALVSCLGYNAIPPPYTRKCLPPKPNLSGLEEFVNESKVSEPTVKKPIVETSEPKVSADKPKVEKKNFGPLLIEDWISDSVDEVESKPKIEKKNVKPSFAKIKFVKSKEQVKSLRKTVKQIMKKLMEDMLPLEVILKEGKLQAETVLHVKRENNTEPLKMYCLVVTDDYSRFTWVFFLASKDKTSASLKTFIIRIENLVDHNVKVIRCDNGTEFKNREMNKFCEMKGIMRQYSVARTPQQNGIAERRNRTLIEAARTMLADLKLPTTFWAEAVNTACYVQNRVKAFRVFNNRTRIVEENLHIRFSENTPNIVGSGPNWLFDIDALTKLMDYKPVVAENQSNGNAVLCPTMVPNFEKMMEVFIGGMPRSIERNVTASKPQTLEEAITITQKLMNQVIKHNYVQGTNDHIRKFDDGRLYNNKNYQKPQQRSPPTAK
nr:putative ribonuclease H-like domain-containing protein [Tanacetum cinerariifolium]